MHSIINKKSFNWFTLVELIIVIIILSILWAIAFTSFQWYIKDTRDSARLSTIKTIEKWIEIYNIEALTYPIPDKEEWQTQLQTWALSIEWVEVEYSYLWEVWDNLRNILKLSKTPTDPLIWNKYVYARTMDWKKYQLATILENSTGYNFLVTRTYAASWYKAKVVWNHTMDVIYTTSTWKFITIVPSLIFDSSWSNILNQTWTLFVVDKKDNLPYLITTLTNKKSTKEILEELRWTWATIITEKIPDNVINWNQTIYEWISQTSNSWTIFTSLWARNDNNAVDVSKLEKIIKWTTTDLNCEIWWRLVNNWEKITMYTENTIAWNAWYDCIDRWQERECSNWEMSWSETYSYLSCIKWVADNCSASWSYVYNWHTYSLPWINHSTSTWWILSSDIPENNWVFKYTLSNIECNDWVLINPSESWTPTPQSCDTWYHISWNSCAPDNCSATTQVVNWHSYDIPILNDWTTQALTSIVNITDWTRTYEQSFSCNNWIISLSWTETNTVNSCVSWYRWANNQCLYWTSPSCHGTNWSAYYQCWWPFIQWNTWVPYQLLMSRWCCWSTPFWAYDWRDICQYRTCEPASEWY